MNKSFFIILFLVLTHSCIAGKGFTSHHWTQLNLYKGIEQRGGPYSFDDTYLELEFGGRYKFVQFYGYIE